MIEMCEMKKILVRIAATVVTALSVACSGYNEGDEAVLKFTSDKTSVSADGVDKVTFKVESGYTDVTSSSKIYRLLDSGERSQISGASFSTTEPGTYTFEAVYGDETIRDQIVVAAYGAAEGFFFRKVCIMKLTQIHCSFCPNGSRKLDILKEFYPGRIVEMAFHSNSMGPDPMAISETDILQGLFGCSYPASIVDLRESAGGDALYSGTKQALINSLESYPAVCGIKLSSEYDGASGRIRIDAAVKADGKCDLRLAVWVIETNLYYPDYPQNDGGYYDSQYRHDHVVRQSLSDNMMGDDLGSLSDGQEVTRQYEVALGDWNLNNVRIVAYAVDKATDTINNITQCDTDGGRADYEYNDI